MRKLLFLVSLPFANPVHVELQGIVTSINMDSLSAAYSDSVGLKVGAAVSFSLELDYSAPPVTFVNGIADTLPNIVYPDPNDTTVYTRNFRFGLAGTRFAQGLFDSPPTGHEDRGVVEHTQGQPDMIEFISIRQWGDSLSWVDLVFPAPDGKLTDSSLGLGQEEFMIGYTPERDAAILLVCAFDITRITISTVSLARPDPAYGPRRNGAPGGNRGGIFRSKGGRFSIDGRRR